MSPVTWLIVSDKQGDNGQVEAIANALGWPVKPQWEQGKPRFRPSLAHLDLARSDQLEAPWPDLIITVGRNPSMVALWVRQQSGGRTKIVLAGKAPGRMLDFSLVVASAEKQMPPLHNLQATTLPFMRADPAVVERESANWRGRLDPLPKPLIAMLVGGKTPPFIMNRKVALELVATAQWVIDELGGTPYITTSRRTAPEVVAVLREQLPKQAVLYEWSAEAPDNPYQALLGTADGFIVTGESISMMVEVIGLGKPLAIFPLPCGVLGSIDQLRRSLARWLFNPRREHWRDRLRHRIARGVYYLDRFRLLSATRDFRAFHHLLVERRLAVWVGEPFRPLEAELPDEMAVVISRIKALFRGSAD